MNKLKVAILFGGCSEEHPVSIKSAREIARNLDKEKYEPIYVGITKSGLWKLLDGVDDLSDGGEYRTAILSPDRSVHGLLILKNGGYSAMRVDVVFPVLHGRLGEDGAMQGLLELSGIPYVGCDVQASALGMDKSLAYIVARHAGVAVPAFWIVRSGEEMDADNLRYPIFVKPARSGSSFGVGKVYDKAALMSAIEDARRYDDKVLLEEAVAGSEVGCAVLGNGAELTIGAVDQIELSQGFFRIHQEAKPENGSENATIRVPARISEEARVRVRETAKAVYRALGCKGLARVDMFLKADGGVVLGEVNTMPGFTAYSRYPRMMAAADMPLSQVIDRAICLALKG